MRNALGGAQSVLVLGGTSDIAQATVRKMVADRCKTVVLAVRRPESLQEFVTELQGLGATVEVRQFEGDQIDTHGAFIDGVFDTAGDIDVVLSAFAVLGNQDQFDLDPTAAGHCAVVNFAAQVSTLTAVAARMKQQGHGLIIALSSVAGERVRKDNAVYGATKAGMDGFCQALSDRLVGTGVDVMIVRPGFVHSKMTEGLDAAPFATTVDAVAQDIVDGIAKRAPIVWSPGILRWVFTVLRHLPRPLWRIISSR